MFRFIVWVSIALVSTSGVAAEYTFVLSNGKYYTVEKDTSGNPLFRPVTVLIIDLDESTPITPATAELTPFEQNIAEMTKKVIEDGGSQITAANLLVSYRVVSESIVSGTLQTNQAFGINRSAADLVLSKRPDKDKWGSWRTSVNDTLMALATQGELKTKEDYVDAYKQVATGINSVITFDGKIVEQTDITDSIKLVRELIKTFSHSQVMPTSGTPLPTTK